MTKATAAGEPLDNSSEWREWQPRQCRKEAASGDSMEDED